MCIRLTPNQSSPKQKAFVLLLVYFCFLNINTFSSLVERCLTKRKKKPWNDLGLEGILEESLFRSGRKENSFPPLFFPHVDGPGGRRLLGVSIDLRVWMEIEWKVRTRWGDWVGVCLCVKQLGIYYTAGSAPWNWITNLGCGVRIYTACPPHHCDARSKHKGQALCVSLTVIFGWELGRKWEPTAKEHASWCNIFSIRNKSRRKSFCTGQGFSLSRPAINTTINTQLGGENTKKNGAKDEWKWPIGEEETDNDLRLVTARKKSGEERNYLFKLPEPYRIYPTRHRVVCCKKRDLLYIQLGGLILHPVRQQQQPNMSIETSCALIFTLLPLAAPPI